MDSASLQARIQHEVAELRTLHPQIALCRTTLDEWTERGQARYALRLDIRWTGHQSLVSGPAKDEVNAALRAAFDAARAALITGSERKSA